MKQTPRLGILLVALGTMLSACSQDDKKSSDSESYSRNYHYDDKGCIASQKVSASTQDEANKKICAAAADDALNKFCALQSRQLFMKENCPQANPDSETGGETPTTGGTPPVPKPIEGPTNWSQKDIDTFNSFMSKARLEPAIEGNASEEAAFVIERIAYCPLHAQGLQCLDSYQTFDKVELAITKDAWIMKIPLRKSGHVYTLSFVDKLWELSLEGTLMGRLKVHQEKLSFPYESNNYIDFYHRSKRILTETFERAQRGDLRCSACDEFKQLKTKLSETLNSRPNIIVGKNSAVYEEGLIELAFEFGLNETDLTGFTEALRRAGAASDIGKVLILNAHPDRTDLKASAVARIEGPGSIYTNRLEIESLGKTHLTLSEELLLISVLRFQGESEYALPIVKRMQLKEDHVEALKNYAPLNLAIEWIGKISSLKSVDALAEILSDQTKQKEIRIQTARALSGLSVRGDRAIQQAVYKAIDAQKAVEKDPEILRLLP